MQLYIIHVALKNYDWNKDIMPWTVWMILTLIKFQKTRKNFWFFNIKMDKYLHAKWFKVIEYNKGDNKSFIKSEFIWPLSRSITPDEMNTSFGPRINSNILLNKHALKSGRDLIPILTAVQ
jgi:hypothetical protein